MSLIEALVALAVMAFGLLGVVGMQSTMRAGADTSRQRSEAVRIAQEEMERLRNYSVLQATDPEKVAGQLAFDEIVGAVAAPAAASNANTSFLLERVVPTSAASDAMSPVREVQVIVSWADRSASTRNQRVVLSSAIAGLPPQMYGLHAMRTDRSPLRQAYGRNAAIPRSATVNPDGTSTFSPPGLPEVTWIFNNATGLITQVCSPTPTPTCTPAERWLLSGFVAFATGAEPDWLEAETPADPVIALSMQVEVTLPTPTTFETCAVETVLGTTNRLAYYCAVPTLDLGQKFWSGKVTFGTLPISATLSDATASNYKICRYTPDGENLQPTSSAFHPDLPVGETEAGFNSRHPYHYRRVNGPLQSKNFLVISAGDGTRAYGCPPDNESTPIESNTWPHQPIS